MSCGCTDEHGYEGPWWGFPPLRNALIAGVVAAVAFVLGRAGLLAPALETAAYLVAIPVGAWHWAREGLEGLVRERVVGIEILMLAATGGAGALGLWDEAAALVVLYGIAEGVEELTFARTRRAIRALLDLAPKQARVLRDGREALVPAETLRPGDRFVVRPGEALPTDGVIVEGHAALDESPVTGESVPAEKGPGEKVFAASINRTGALVVEATAAFADNTLSKIIHLVESAQERKGRAQEWMERFGRRYSPAVLATAAAFLVLPLPLGWDWADWAHRAVVLLVAAAPCALVISLPIAISAGIGAAGRRGILIKGGAHLEHLALIRVVAFDKTGTLTHGRPEVTAVEPLGTGLAAGEALRLAASLEARSEHPLARAIVRHARARGIEAPPAEGFRALVGAGVEGRVDGRTWRVLRPGAEGLALGGEAAARCEALAAEGHTVVVLADAEGRPAALIALADRVREEAPEAVRRLHALGVRCVMLTGDNPQVAARVAAAVGIDEVRAGLRPEDKVEAVRALEARHGAVIMVGDGINDAPALAAATCGIAMGAAGTDAAIEAADVALMADDLLKVAEALELGRQARRVSLQNIVFALSVLAVLIPLGVLGRISVAFAVLVHEASELAAVANGLRAGRLPRRQPPAEM